MNEARGEAILEQAVAGARDEWGARLVAAYALGSLAHGGFSDLVSDVDLGLVLADPLTADDAARVAALGERVRVGGAPLADRLSVFWGTAATLRGEGALGHYPPLDRLDLARHGRLLAGRDCRARLPTPTTRELVVAAAAQALRSLAAPAVIAEPRRLRGPRRRRRPPPDEAHSVPRTLSLYGRDGGDRPRPRRRCSLRGDAGGADGRPCRSRAPLARDSARARPRRFRARRGRGHPAASRHFVADHERRLRDYDEPELAQGFAAWRAALGDD